VVLHDDALYKSTFTLLYFKNTVLCYTVKQSAIIGPYSID